MADLRGGRPVVLAVGADPARRAAVHMHLSAVVAAGGRAHLVTAEPAWGEVPEGVVLHRVRRRRPRWMAPLRGRAAGVARGYGLWRAARPVLRREVPDGVDAVVITGPDAWATAWHVARLRPGTRIGYDVPADLLASP